MSGSRHVTGTKKPYDCFRGRRSRWKSDCSLTSLFSLLTKKLARETDKQLNLPSRTGALFSYFDDVKFTVSVPSGA